MTVATLAPNEDLFWLGYEAAHINPPGSLGWQVTSDSDDGTWAKVGEWILGFGTFTIPPGGIVRSVRVVTRGYNADNPFPVTMLAEVGTGYPDFAVLASFSVTYPNLSVVDRSTATSSIVADQTTVDALAVHIRRILGYGDYITITKLALDVIYAAVPVVVVGAPAGTIVQAAPTQTWTYSGDIDADGGGVQQRFHIKTFTAAQYGAVGFDPATSTAAYDSGEVMSSATGAVIGPFVNLTTFKTYMRVAQNVNGAPHWSVWTAGAEFTTDTDPPQVATISATISGAAVKVRVTRVVNAAYLTPTIGTVTTPDPGLLPTESVFIFTERQGFTGEDHVIVSQDIAGQRSWDLGRGAGAAQWLWTQFPAGDDSGDVQPTHTGGSSAPTGGDETYAISYDQNAAGARQFITYRSDGDGTWTPVGTPSGAPLLAMFDSTAPIQIGAHYGIGVVPWEGRIYSVELRTGLDPAAGTVVWRFDADDYPGTGTSYVDPRGRTWTLTTAAAIHTDNDWTHVNVERSDDASSTWRPVRGALEYPAPDDTVTVYDYEHPEGIPLRYRARGVIKDGVTVLSQGDWKTTSTPLVWTGEPCGEWLRAPLDPAGAVLIEVVADEATITTAHRVGILDVIGRASPVTVWDVPTLPAGTLNTITRSYTDGLALRDLVRTSPVLLWQGRRVWGHPHRWLVVTGHTVSRHPSPDSMFSEYREWELAYVEVDEPPVLT